VSSAIESQKIIEEKCRLEREYANDIGSLENSLEEDEELRVSLRRSLNPLRSHVMK
jgi:hypothetical protein